MKNGPTICQDYVHAALMPVPKKWPQIKCFHFMSDLLIAHPSFTLLQQALRDSERCLAKEGLIIAPNKTHLYPPFKYLGHTVVDNIVKPPKLKLDIKEVMTLNKLQTLLGNINWIQPFLKIPLDSLKPVCELLKGNSQLNSLRKLTPEAQQAIQLVKTLQHSFINRTDPSQPLQLLIWGTPTTPTLSPWSPIIIGLVIER
jgi:hypothetical protein